jgi:hypothetical protein
MSRPITLSSTLNNHPQLPWSSNDKKFDCLYIRKQKCWVTLKEGLFWSKEATQKLAGFQNVLVVWAATFRQ